DHFYQQLLSLTSNINFDIANVAGQYIVLPFISKDLPQLPQIKYQGALYKLQFPYSQGEKDVIMPDVLQFDVDKATNVVHLYTDLVLKSYLYREVPVDEGGDICNTRACYLFATERVTSMCLIEETIRLLCTNTEVGCQPTILLVGKRGYAIYIGTQFVGMARLEVYKSPSERFGAYVYDGRVKFELWKSVGDIQFKNTFVAFTTIIVPCYWNPDGGGATYPDGEYGEEGVTNPYLGDIHFLGTEIELDMAIIITRVPNAYILPLSVMVNGRYKTVDDVDNKYMEIAHRLIPAELYPTLYVNIYSYPQIHLPDVHP
ncbi:MAG: hypothetical protein DRO14_06395, partial [Thermoprotei archaeon]